MQLVVSLNPAVDVEWRVETVRWEEKNQVLTERRWPGGKGINVARWLAHLGGDPRLVIPLGGTNGEEMAAGLRRLDIPFSPIPLRESSRANVVVTTAAGKQLRFNPLGPKLSSSEWGNVLSTTQRELGRAKMLIVSGALPRGVPTNAYAQLLKLANEAGVKSILDCDGPALNAGIKARPFLVKPNEFELAQWRGKAPRSESSVLRAAHALSEATGGWVLVSRGPKGALLAGKDKTIVCRAPAVRVRNTIGAGDALLAAAALQIEKESLPEEWFIRGIAAGTAATECSAGALPKTSRIATLAGAVRAQLLSAANR
jgi:1-phosphofructokinase family hexose kinase